ncbi:hypothetical protein [Roseibium sp. M-1]
MIADDLATQLAARYVNADSRVLDPFCGSGRLLAASEQAATRIGIDANPLAWLITASKLKSPDLKTLTKLLEDISNGRKFKNVYPLEFTTGRKVDWFSDEIILDLSKIICWINTYSLSGPTLFLVGAVLSATARESSYARDSGWKLHRMSELARSQHQCDPWTIFERRLRYCVRDLSKRDDIEGTGTVVCGRVGAEVSKVLETLGGPFDLVLTSPPYGDSRTTVHYGAASELCLGVVRHVKGLSHLFEQGRTIDAACIGESLNESNWDASLIKRYWSGSLSNPASTGVEKFLCSYDAACNVIGKAVKPGGRAVFIVGRRSTGGFRLRLDNFTMDRFTANGFKIEDRYERTLQKKRSPLFVNRYARSQSEELRSRGFVRTFDRDIVVVLRKND